MANLPATPMAGKPAGRDWRIENTPPTPLKRGAHLIIVICHDEIGLFE